MHIFKSQEFSTSPEPLEISPEPLEISPEPVGISPEPSDDGNAISL